jgi:hypothetical protein
MAKGVEKISPDYYFLQDARALVEITGPQVDTIDGSPTTRNSGGIEWAYWGADNLKPQRMLKLVAANHIKPQLISTSRDFLLGLRPGVFRKVIENKKTIMEPVENPAMEDWLEQVDAVNYLRSAFYNLEFFGNVFSVASLDASRKIEGIQNFDGTDTRAGKRNPKNGKIEKYFLNPDWANFRKTDNVIVPAYDRTDPLKYAEFLYHGRDFLPGQSYYDQPAWWGTEAWTKVSNKIPIFHDSGLDNGYNIRYHIRIPRDYFSQFGEAEAQQKAEEELTAEMNRWLAGAKNAGKAFVSKFATGMDGKIVPGWEIVPVDSKLSDEAYDRTTTQANMAHIQGHGIDPTLANIESGKVVGGSGSEKLISYKLHIALRTPNKRAIVLDFFNRVIKPIMGWPRELYIGIEDIDVSQISPPASKGVGRTQDPSNPQPD